MVRQRSVWKLAAVVAVAFVVALLAHDAGAQKTKCKTREAQMKYLMRGAVKPHHTDAGMLLAALYRAGFPGVAHGPVVQDIQRDGGAAAVGRALAWMVERAPAALEPSITAGTKTAAFNITVLSHLLGTPLQPDLGAHVLLVDQAHIGRQ